MSFITSPGVIVPPLTAGAAAYGTGSQAKMNSAGTVGQVLTSAGAGVPTWTTPSAVTFPVTVPQGGTNLTTLTANNVILGNGASAPTFVAPGTSGNVLTSNGTTWASTAVAASGLVLIAAATASSVSSVDFTSGIDSTYDEYELHFQNVIPVSASPNLFLRTSADSGATFAAASGNYSFSVIYNYSNGILVQGDGNATSTGLVIDGNTTVTSGASIGGISGVIRLINPAGTASVKQFIWDTNNQSTTTVSAQVRGSGSRNATAVVNAVRFIFSTGNIASGLFKLYGLRKSV